MKTTDKAWTKYVSIFLLLFVLGFSGCEDDSDPVAPDLPPLATFVMDFSDFAGADGKNLTVPAKGAESQSALNWGWAASNVLVWNTILTVNLVVPVASFYEAFNHEAVYQGNNEWIWAYNFMAGAVSHKAELHGTLESSQVVWDMYISKEDVYSDFLWYTGYSNLLGTEGQWTLYNNPEDTTTLLSIDWTRSADDESADIKYTNIVPGGEHYGSYIYYGRTNETPLDRFYDINNAAQQNLMNIEWSVTTKEGRVKDPHFFGNSDWHCWDATLQDIDCE